MKDNCEGNEFAPSFSISEPKINAEEGDIVNYDKGSFGSEPKEENRSDLISSSKLPNEVEDKPLPARCEIGNLKEKHLVQRDAKSYEFWTLLQHDEVASTSEERLEIIENHNPTITIVDIYEPSSLVGGRAERKIHK